MMTEGEAKHPHAQHAKAILDAMNKLRRKRNKMQASEPGGKHEQPVPGYSGARLSPCGHDGSACNFAKKERFAKKEIEQGDEGDIILPANP